MIKLLAAVTFVVIPSASPPVAPRVLFPGNVVCSDFDKVGPRTWDLKHVESLDLGNWDGPLVVSGPIMAGRFVAHGHDLFDVLEGKCKVSASL